MATMRYIDSGLREPEQTVAFWIKEAIDAGIGEFRCQAGYFTLEGASLLLPTLKSCAAEGAVVRLLLGSNGGATLASHVAFLAGTLGIPQKHVSMGIVGFDTSLFHPKVYHVVRRNGSQTAYVGSANLTGPGIAGMNVEAGIILDTEEGDDTAILGEISARIESWFHEGSPGLAPISGPRDIDDLLAIGRLALRPVPRPREQGEEGSAAAESRPRVGARLKAIYELPTIEEGEGARSPRRVRRAVIPSDATERERFIRHTEASFHYPQGTHLGHILSILWHFSKERAGTPFDDNYIRLNGSLGSGRLAAYRRQVKYKILAAIELGLITDIRLVEDSASYVPELTESGRELWRLLASYVNTNDLILEADEDGDYSTTTPQQPHFYNGILYQFQQESEEFRELYQRIFLNMPAVKQMLKFLYHQERTNVVSKARVYENFFQSEPVQNFCDAMGIDPATHEAAKRRCPFLLNVLESCGIVSQGQFDVTVNRLALSPDLLVPEGVDPTAAEAVLQIVIDEWGSGISSLDEQDQKNLRNLFGAQFLTDRYYLSQVIGIPS